MNPCRLLVGIITVIAIVMSARCTVTETGNPKKVVIDTDSIYLQKNGQGVRMVGEEGAVTPGGSQLRIVDLDAASEPVNITVKKDGSFSVDLTGSVDHVYRLRATYKQMRSKPVTISGNPIELAECIEPEPEDVLEFPETETGESVTRSIVLTNRCDREITLAEQAFRLRVSAISMPESTDTREIEAGGKLTIEVTFAPKTPGLYEAIAVFKFVSEGRIVIDITGTTPGSDTLITALNEAKSGVCYGDDTNCSPSVDPIVSGYPFAQTATDENPGTIEVAWLETIEEVECPLPPCYLRYPKIAVANDGSILVTAKVSLADMLEKEWDKYYLSSNQPILGYSERPGVGVWFGRYSAEGKKQFSDWVEFTPPSDSGFIDYTCSVAADSQGHAYLLILSQYQPDNGNPREMNEPKQVGSLSVFRYDLEGQLIEIPITRSGIQDASLFVDPEDNIVLVTHYRNPDAPYPIHEDDTTTGIVQYVLTRADISKYDSSGKLLWNQTGLNGDALSTVIHQVDFDANANLFASISQRDDSTEREWSVARLDESGNIEMQRVLSNPEFGRIGGVAMAVSPSGDWSLLSSVEMSYQYASVSGGAEDSTAWITATVMLDRYTMQGAALWSWQLQIAPQTDDGDLNTPPRFASITGDSKGTSYVYSPIESFEGEPPRFFSFRSNGEDYSVYAIERERCSPQKNIPLCNIYMMTCDRNDAIYFSSSLLEYGSPDSSMAETETGFVSLGKLSQTKRD
jgi:hypothetical protein